MKLTRIDKQTTIAKCPRCKKDALLHWLAHGCWLVCHYCGYQEQR